MTRHFPIPLKLNCTGLSRKRTMELAEKLAPHFDSIEYWNDDELIAIKPFSKYHYSQAWDVIDSYGVAWQ